MEQKKHPGYKEAIEQILKIFDEKGYGVIITDEQFDGFMSIHQKKELMTYQDFKNLEMERLQKYKSIEVLLSEHNICLNRSKSVPGFELLPPKEQVDVAFNRRMARVRRELNRAQMAITNVNHSLLTMEEEEDRQKKLVRTAFIRCAISKRKIALPAQKEVKLIKE